MPLSDADYLKWLRSDAPKVTLLETTYDRGWKGIHNRMSNAAKVTQMSGGLKGPPGSASISLIWRGRVATLEAKTTHMSVGAATKYARMGWDASGNLYAKITDGTNTVEGTLGAPAFATGVHVFAWVFDRDADTATGYVDGEACATVLNIAAVTGALDAASSVGFANVPVDSWGYDLLVYYRALRQAEIVAYGADYEDIPENGNWQCRYRPRIGFESFDIQSTGDRYPQVRFWDRGPYLLAAGGSAFLQDIPPIGYEYQFEDADDGGVESLYLATALFVSGAADTPAKQIYDDRLIGPPHYSQQLPDTIYGVAETSVGSIHIDNTDNRLNRLIDGHWQQRDFRLLLGDPSWPRADFRTRLKGKIRGIQATDSEIILAIRDTHQEIARGDIVGPVAYGHIAICAPSLVTGNTYRVDTAAVNDVLTVWDDGVSVAFTKDLPNGKFTTTATPTGNVTAEVRGRDNDMSANSVAKTIIEDFTALVAGDIGTFAGVDVADEVSLHIQAGSVMRVLDALNGLARFTFAGIYTGRDGLVVSRRIDHGTAPVVTFDEDDIESVALEQIINPWSSYAILDTPNWGPLFTELALSVGAGSAAKFKVPFSGGDGFNDDVLLQWPNAPVLPESESVLWGQDSSPTAHQGYEEWFELQRAMFWAPVEFWRIELRVPPTLVNILDQVGFVYSKIWPRGRWGLTIGIDEQGGAGSLLVVMR